MILASASFGLVAGITGASILVGWIWPSIAGEDLMAISQTRNARARQELDAKVREEKVNGRFAEVYSTSVPFGQTVTLGVGDKLGEAMIVGSDGWLALYRPAGIVNYKNWRVILADGSFYKLENALFDKYSGFAYLKLAKNKVAGQDSIQLNNLVDYREAELKAGDDIYIWQNNNWYHGLATYAIRAGKTIPHLDTAPNEFFALDDVYNVGAVAINSQGRVVGVVTEKHLLLPITDLARILPRVLSEQKIFYPTLGMEGWFSSEQPVVYNMQELSGFAISRVFAGTSLKKGDVITKINGETVSMDKMWYAKDQVLRLEVWRNGKIVNLDVRVGETQ